MADMIDATNPANIPAGYDGTPAMRITTQAATAGQAFDYSDTGNAGAQAVARAVEWRYQQGMWSVGYTNESQFEALSMALELFGLAWLDASLWPRKGVYLWAADPSGNIAAGRWKPPATPLAVQDRYQGTYDLSTVHGAFPGRVAGYIDGPQSQWPAAAWFRFVGIPDAAPEPVLPDQEDLMHVTQLADGTLVIAAKSPDGHLLLFSAKEPAGGFPATPANSWSVIDVSDNIGPAGPANSLYLVA